MNEKPDIEEVTKFVLETQERIKFLSEMFPQNKKTKHLIKSLAAASIHMTFFVRDLYDMTQGTPSKKEDELEKEFLDKCGCKEEVK